MKPAFHSKRLLITGIAGFSGYHMESWFRDRGYDVYGTTEREPRQPNHFKCDIRNKDEISQLIEMIKPNYVIHMAAISFVGERDISRIYDINVIGTCNLLDALSNLETAPKKVILASSATIYGNQNSEILDESMCPNPVNHYGCSKLAMEQMASTYGEKFPIVITRPFNYTGPGQAEHFLIPKIVAHYRQKNDQIELGNLHVEREFNDIRDVCRVYEKLLDSSVGSQTVNLCTGRGIALLDVIEIMNEIAGYTIDIKVNPAFVRPNEIKRLVGSTEELVSLIGEIPLRDFRETLQCMYDANQ